MKNRPLLKRCYELYHRCFSECTTCRQIGMGVGPIPWDAVMRWCEVMDMDRSNSAHVWRVVSAVDGEYLRMNRDEPDKDKDNGGSQLSEWFGEQTASGRPDDGSKDAGPDRPSD